MVVMEAGREIGERRQQRNKASLRVGDLWGIRVTTIISQKIGEKLG